MNKGQTQIIVTAITATAILIGSWLTSWATASNRVGMTERNIAVVEERENNHFAQVQKQLEDINKKLDTIADKLNVKK